MNNKALIDFISNYIKTNNIKFIFDLGCGDFSFFKNFNFNNLKYFGVDSDEIIIDKNNSNYRTPNIKFFHGNITNFVIDKPCDLIIIKDVFANLCNDEVFQILFNFRNYSKILIINDYIENNIDISNGQYRGINLNLWPFYAYAECLYELQNNNTIKKCMLVDGKKMFPESVLN